MTSNGTRRMAAGPGASASVEVQGAGDGSSCARWEGRRVLAGWLLPLGLAAITGLAFAPTLWNGFVAWDDYDILVNNPDYRGLSWPQLRWMATTVLLGHYVPLTWLTFGLDYVVWGMNPTGYHLTSLLLHAANVAVLYFVSARLLAKATILPEGARRVGAATAALFFGIHPLRVESVAWVTERRDVLSGLFFLVTVLIYLEACKAEGRRRRWLLAASVGAYVLALASKAIVMTLPAVLLLLDIYPLRRLSADPRAWWGRSARRVWLEKVPYALLGVCGAVIAYYGQKAGASVVSFEKNAWIGVAVHTLWLHVYRTLLPRGLSPLYELPYSISLWEPRYLISIVGVAAITVSVLLARRMWPAGLAVWAYYVLQLAPVTGLVHAGPQFTADRYSYLSCLGWALLVGAGTGVAVRAAARGSLRLPVARLLAGAGVVWFLGLGLLTWQQVQIWHDTERLWRHAVAATPECSLCRSNLGNVLMEQGLHLAALEQFRMASLIRSDWIRVHNSVGMALVRLGRLPEAIAHYKHVLAEQPQMLAVRTGLATALMGMGMLAETVETLRAALRFNRAEDVAAYFRQAVAATPTDAIPHLGLFEAHVALGELGSAREQLEALQELNPALASLVAGALAPRQ